MLKYRGDKSDEESFWIEGCKLFTAFYLTALFSVKLIFALEENPQNLKEKENFIENVSEAN